MRHVYEFLKYERSFKKRQKQGTIVHFAGRRPEHADLCTEAIAGHGEGQSGRFERGCQQSIQRNGGLQSGEEFSDGG